MPIKIGTNDTGEPTLRIGMPWPVEDLRRTLLATFGARHAYVTVIELFFQGSGWQ